MKLNIEFIVSVFVLLLFLFFKSVEESHIVKATDKCMSNFKTLAQRKKL